MTIELQGIELHGHHGLLEHERRDGQLFLFDVELDLVDGETVVRTDSVTDTADYREIVTTVREVSDGRSYVTIEALADVIACTLLERFRVSRVRVRVRKPEVDLGLPVVHAAVVVERRV